MNLPFDENFHIDLVTFGEPNPGNRAFADELNRNPNRLNSVRVTNSFDVVPRVLSCSTAMSRVSQSFPVYEHSGSLVVLDNDFLKKALVVSDALLSLTDAQNAIDKVKDGLSSCINECFESHGIDTLYATNLIYYLAPNGIEKMVDLITKSPTFSKLKETVIAYWKNAAAPVACETASQLVSAKAGTLVAAGRAAVSCVSSIVPVLSVVNTVLGVVNVAATVYVAYQVKEMRLEMDAGFGKLLAGQQDIKATLASSEQRIVASLVNSEKMATKNMADLATVVSHAANTVVASIEKKLDEVQMAVTSKFSESVLSQSLERIHLGKITMGSILQEWPRVYGPQLHGENASLFQSVIGTADDCFVQTCVFLNGVNAALERSDQGMLRTNEGVYAVIECALETLRLKYLSRKGSPHYRESNFECFLEICFHRNSYLPGFFDMIGRLFLTLRRDPACQKQVQNYSELVGSVLWDVWRDAEMSASLAHPEAPKALSLTSQNVTGSNVSDRFSSSSVVHNMGINSPFNSVKIVSASALSLEQEGRWREGLQCALLTAVSPANVGSVASIIVALDMQLGITVIQVWR